MTNIQLLNQLMQGNHLSENELREIELIIKILQNLVDQRKR